MMRMVCVCVMHQACCDRPAAPTAVTPQDMSGALLWSQTLTTTVSRWHLQGIDCQGFHADTMHMARLWNSSRTMGKGYSLEVRALCKAHQPRC
jgi:hypothetical protein